MAFGRVPGSWVLYNLGSTYPVAPVPGARPASPPVPPAPPPSAPKRQSPKKKVPSGSPLTKFGEKISEMNLSFDPEESLTITSCEAIAFGQTCQIVADGRVLSKPSEFTPSWKFRDVWTLINGVFLDQFENAAGPYYEIGAPGRFVDRGQGQGFLAEAATMGDAPFVESDAIMFDSVRNPRGFKEVVFKLETFAGCKSGADVGHWYQGCLWEWRLTAQEFKLRGRGAVVLRAINVAAPSSDFLAAFDKYKRVTQGTP